MTPERLAEWQKFAEDARCALLRGEGTKLVQDGMMGFVELIDALTAERERAEKAIDLAWRLYHEASSGGGCQAYQFEEWHEELKELEK